MAISRPLLLAVLGAVLLGATLFAVQHARDKSSSESAAPAAQTQAPAPSGKAGQPQPAKMSPQQAVQAGFSNLSVRSGKFDLSFDVKGVSAGKVQRTSADVSGSFQSQGKTEVPKFDVRVKASDGSG